MSNIKLKRKHSLSLEEARAAAERVAEELDKEYGLTSRWEGDALRFTRSGVDGLLKVTKKEVVLDAKLGFLLSAFKSKIESHINDDFDKYFA